MKKGIIMKIDNAKSIKIASQPQFKGETATAKKEEESSNNTGKVLLALAGLAALGGGAYLILRKNKDAKDAAKDAAKEVKNEVEEELINVARPTLIEAPKTFSAATRHIVEFMQKITPFVEKSEKAKLKKIAKTFIFNRHLSEEQRGKYPKLILVKGSDSDSQTRVKQGIPLLTISHSHEFPKDGNPQTTLDNFHKELQKNATIYTNIHVLEDADMVFKRLKEQVTPEIYEQEVDKMSTAIEHAGNEKLNSILFSAKDENALPEKIRAHIKDENTINTKPYENPFPLAGQRPSDVLLRAADKFHDLLENEPSRLARIAERFDENASLPIFKRREIFAANIDSDFTKRKGESIPNGIVIVGHDKDKIAQTIKLLPEFTRSKADKLEGANTIAEVNKGLEQKVKDAKEHYKNTGEVTLIDIGNIREILVKTHKANSDEATKADFKAFLPHIQFQHKPREYVLIMSTDDPGAISNSHFLSIDSRDFLKIKEAKIEEAIAKKPDAHDVDFLREHIYKSDNPYDGESQLLQLTEEFEVANRYPYTEILNPIYERHRRTLGLVGNPERCAKVVEKLPALLDATLVNTSIKGKSASQIIDLIHAETQKAEERFKQTGRRTILNLGDVTGPSIKRTHEDPRNKAYSEFHHGIMFPEQDTKLIIVHSSESRDKMPLLFREYHTLPDSFVNIKTDPIK